MNQTQVCGPSSGIKLRRSIIVSALLLLAGTLTGLPEPAQAAVHHHKAAATTTSRGDLPPANARPVYESIVVDANTGRVLHQVNADQRAYPASLTKMMTLYMLFDALQKGKVHLDTPMTVSAHAAAQDPSKLDLAPGSTIAVEPAIYAIVTKSANDVAVVIAEHLGGTEEHFCSMMTERAHALGMSRTQFRDASGLPNKDQLSTARDIAILARHLMIDFPDQFTYFSKTEFPFRGVMIKGHNHFMENYDGADGLKTGFTAASGFNLAGTARRGDQRLITVMFGGASAKIRDDHVAALMDAGFNMLENNPTAVANAQPIVPFPPAPEASPVLTASEDGATPAPAAATVASTSAVVPNSASSAFDTVTPAPIAPVTVAAIQPETSAGDIDDSIAQKIATTEPPLAATATLVPAPGTPVAGGKHASKHVASYMPAQEPTAANATWGIQIGAYANRNIAEEKATAVREKVQPTFTAATTRVVQVKAKHGVLYRAQVVGLSHKDVMKACRLAATVALGGCKPVSPDPTRVAMR